MQVDVCALATPSGEPVTFWHIGSANIAGSQHISAEHCREWSRSAFEYVDCWLHEESERLGRILGHVQVFDLEGIGWRHTTATALHDKLKAVMGAGEFYVESVSHIYVVNASTMFKMIWSAVKPLLPPRTATKITVESGVPKSLEAALGSDSLALLEALRKKTGTKNGAVRPQVQRPRS